MNGENQEIVNSCVPQEDRQRQEERFVILINNNGLKIVATKEGDIVEWGFGCPDALSGIDLNSIKSDPVEHVFETKSAERSFYFQAQGLCSETFLLVWI
jgi:hypothetical protein